MGTTGRIGSGSLAEEAAAERFPALARLMTQREKVRPLVAGDLERPAEIAAALGNPQDKVPSVHVTGTNGKGTVSSYVAAIFHCASLRVGQTSSPHLQDIRERFLIGGAPASEEDLEPVLAKIYAVADSHGDVPSFFDVATLGAFLLFAEKKLERMVIEVGLGGKLDSTNIMKAPLATTITSVGLDHQAILGDTKELIAEDKAHIFRPGVPAICGVRDESVRRVIESVARRVGTVPEFIGRDFDVDSAGVVTSPAGTFQIPLQELDLLAPHQFHNAAVAVRLAQVAGAAPEAIQMGLIRARWPGRLERIDLKTSEGPRKVLLDGAHNEDGVTALLNYLTSYLRVRPAKKLVFVTSILQTKRWEAMLEQFSEFEKSQNVSAEWIFSQSAHALAVSSDEVQNRFGRGRSIPDVETAVGAALNCAGPEDLVIVTGSLYLIGGVRPLLTGKPFSTIA